MFKCIKEVTFNGDEVYFKKGETYHSHKYRFTIGHETRDEYGNEHVIGREGDEWFDEHFVDAIENAKNEEYYNFMIESYKDMPNHDEIETKALQEYIRKQTEDIVAPYKVFHAYFMNLYKQGLKVSYWSADSKSEPFDNFIEATTKEMKKEVDDKWKNSQDGG